MILIYTQTLYTGYILHRVDFKAEFNKVLNWRFLFFDWFEMTRDLIYLVILVMSLVWLWWFGILLYIDFGDLNNNSTDTNETLSYKNISHFILEKDQQFVFSWEIDKETYTQREDFFPYLLPGTRGCQHLHPLATSSGTPLIDCLSLARL